jgi:hypothetical protein
VVPNIAILTRLGLFVETVAAFLTTLRGELPTAFATVPAGYVKRYLDREGHFSDAKRSQAPRRLFSVAQDVLALHDRFIDDEVVAALPAFVTLRRLLNEQCNVVEVDPNAPSGGAPGADEGDDEPTEVGRRIRVKQANLMDPMASPVEGATEVSAADAAAPDSDLNLGDFAFDTTCQMVLCCPGGFEPQTQHMTGGQLIARFSAENCLGCPSAALCPLRELVNGDRQLRLSPAQIATELRQVEQQQGPFKDRYVIRSGIESTNNELKHAHGLGHLRVRGREQVRLAATLKAASVNVKRAVMYHLRLMLQPPPELVGSM